MDKTEQTPAKKKFSFSALWGNKRTRSILIAAGVILLCVAVYVVLLFTVLKEDDTKTEKPTIGNHGEKMVNGKPFVIDPFEADNILSIKVENEKGGYEYYKGEDDKYYLRDAEAMLYNENAAWNEEGFSEEQLEDMLSALPITSSLVNLSSYMLADQELVGYDKDNLAAYGLADRGKATMTVTYLDGDGKEITKTVYIGSQVLSGSGYYCMLEGRDAVYILADDYNVGRCMFSDERAFMLPQVSPAVSTSVYTDVSTLSIKKHGADFLSLRKVTEEEYKQNGELFTHVFENPQGYYPSPENLQTLLYTFTNFKGEEVMEYGITKRLQDPAQRDSINEMFTLYSLMDQNREWNYEISYTYPGFNCTLYISEKLEVSVEGGEEGAKEYIYYVYSPDFDCIVEFKAEAIDWVEWDLLTFMDNHSFAVSIDNVSTVEMKYEGTDVKFTLTGTKNELKVQSSTGINVETDNFRQLYKAILFTTMDGYADQPGESTSILSLKITLRDGTVYDYDFYGLTARKAYYSLNGSGQFYINRDYVKQMISACTGILNGETVTVERKN
ncbi:MAG: DUF4340 domain-containing protein [Clostridia bacterium]|nr:DUF4340 domain-containing protein [Clostridia bacterium]